MITFVTGLPGHGKTLNTIYEIDTLLKLARKNNELVRPVYYFSKESVDSSGAGIAGLSLEGWFPFTNLEGWFQLPDSAIIVIDECQYAFPAKGKTRNGDIPQHIEQFTEHRKKGFDIFLISQDAMNVDHYIRRLAGQHLHYHRPFGASKSVRWEYQRVVNPYDKFTQKEAISRNVVSFPKQYFNAYSSANIHTVKRKIPKKLFLIPVFLIVLVFCVYFTYITLAFDETSNIPDIPKTENFKTDNISTPVLPASIPAKPVYDLAFFQSLLSGVGDDSLGSLPKECSFTKKVVKCLIKFEFKTYLSNTYCLNSSLCYVVYNRLYKPDSHQLNTYISNINQLASNSSIP